MTLFKLGDFRLHSGGQSFWKIDCDDLTDDDIDTLSTLMALTIGPSTPIKKIIGVPEGGSRLAARLGLGDRVNMQEGRRGITLIVDDVFTTGGAMLETLRSNRLREHEAVGLVVFARKPCPWWVTPLFRYEGLVT